VTAERNQERVTAFKAQMECARANRAAEASRIEAASEQRRAEALRSEAASEQRSAEQLTATVQSLRRAADERDSANKSATLELQAALDHMRAEHQLAMVDMQAKYERAMEGFRREVEEARCRFEACRCEADEARSVTDRTVMARVAADAHIAQSASAARLGKPALPAVAAGVLGCRPSTSVTVSF
jgi:hypothetical protein